MPRGISRDDGSSSGRWNEAIGGPRKGIGLWKYFEVVVRRMYKCNPKGELTNSEAKAEPYQHTGISEIRIQGRLLRVILA